MKSSPVYCVTCHINLNDGNESIHPTTNAVANQYIEMMKLMFKSFSLFHPQGEKVLLTNHASTFPELDASIQVIREEINKDTLMYDRMLAQLRFLTRAPEGALICFLDTDVLIAKPLDHVIDQSVDIGLTYRAQHEMPINGGVIFVRNNKNSRRFWQRTVEYYDKLSAESRQWWGDQAAIAQYLSDFNVDYRKPIVEVDDLKIGILDCQRYNYTPRDLKAIEAPLDKYILHFKGAKKSLMNVYWDAHLKSCKTYNPLVLISSYRARKLLRNSIKVTNEKSH